MLNVFAADKDQITTVYRVFQAAYNYKLPSPISPIVEPGRVTMSIIGVYPEHVKPLIEAGLEEFKRLLEIAFGFPIVVTFAFIQIQFELNAENTQ